MFGSLFLTSFLFLSFLSSSSPSSGGRLGNTLETYSSLKTKEHGNSRYSRSFCHFNHSDDDLFGDLDDNNVTTEEDDAWIDANQNKII